MHNEFIILAVHELSCMINCFKRMFKKMNKNLCKVKSMDDNCGEWVECMGVASGCG